MLETLYLPMNEEEDVSLPQKEKPYDWEDDMDFASAIAFFGLAVSTEMRKPRPFTLPAPRPHEYPPVYDIVGLLEEVA